MNDDIRQLTSDLRLHRLAEVFDEELQRAEELKLPYQEFAARLLRAQSNRRREAALTARIKRARIPEQWSLETFPFKRQPGVDERQIRTFAQLDFIGAAENIVLVGPTGVGKTGLA